MKTWARISSFPAIDDVGEGAGWQREQEQRDIGCHAHQETSNGDGLRLVINHAVATLAIHPPILVIERRSRPCECRHGQRAPRSRSSHCALGIRLSHSYHLGCLRKSAPGLIWRSPFTGGQALCVQRCQVFGAFVTGSSPGRSWRRVPIV